MILSNFCYLIILFIKIFIINVIYLVKFIFIFLFIRFKVSIQINF